MIPSRITDPRPDPLGRAHFPTSPPAEITARNFGVYTRSGINGMSGDDMARADDDAQHELGHGLINWCWEWRCPL